MHPVLAMALGESDEVIARVPGRSRLRCSTASRCGRRRLEVETGFYLLAIRRAGRYLYRPRGMVRLAGRRRAHRERTRRGSGAARRAVRLPARRGRRHRRDRAGPARRARSRRPGSRPAQAGRIRRTPGGGRAAARRGAPSRRGRPHRPRTRRRVAVHLRDLGHDRRRADRRAGAGPRARRRRSRAYPGSRTAAATTRSERTSSSSVEVGQREDAQRGVAGQLGGEPTDAEHHERSERRVAGHPDDRLDARRRPSAARPRRPSRRRGGSPSRRTRPGRRRRRPARGAPRRRRSCGRSRPEPALSATG